MKTLWKQSWSKHIFIARFVLAISAAVIFVAPMVGDAQTVTQSYGTTGTVQPGMIVMLDPGNASNVEQLTNTKAKSMLGVAVAASDTPVTLNSGASGTPTYVATTGKYPVLASTQNGSIKAGDLVSISALDGIAMKADNNEPLVLGKALANFDTASPSTSTADLQTSNGTQKVSIGQLQVAVDISANPLANSDANSNVPAFLERIATAIAGKPVSAPRIYMCLAILLVCFLITGILLYGGVRSSLTAIGRNPLARGAVLRGMVQVLLTGVVILVIGLAVIYLLLKL